MSDYISRLEVDHTELSDRLEKLSAFLNQKKPEFVTACQWEQMQERKITKEFLESEVKEKHFTRIGDRITHCRIVTHSGFEFTGESAVVDAKNFDEKLGEQYAYEQALDGMWMPYGFWLHKVLTVDNQQMNDDGESMETPVLGGSNINRYRKKPVVVRAWKFDGTTDSLPPMNHTDHKLWYREHDRVNDQHFPPTVVVRTLEGDMTAQVGDYIIEGVNGEFYPCKPDIFEKTYEKVE